MLFLRSISFLSPFFRYCYKYCLILHRLSNTQPSIHWPFLLKGRYIKKIFFIASKYCCIPRWRKCNSFCLTWTSLFRQTKSITSTEEPRLTATPLIRSPRYYGHFFGRQNGHTFAYKKTPLMWSPVNTANGNFFKFPTPTILYNFLKPH